MTEEIRKWYENCLTIDERMEFDERAAILEFHGNISHLRAEWLAYQMMWQKLLTTYQKGESS